MGTVYKKDGLYLRYSEHSTHTGAHYSAEWVEDVNSATVFYMPPAMRLRQSGDLNGAERLDATETRTVTLVPNAQVTGRTPADGGESDELGENNER